MFDELLIIAVADLADPDIAEANASGHAAVTVAFVNSESFSLARVTPIPPSMRVETAKRLAAASDPAAMP